MARSQMIEGLNPNAETRMNLPLIFGARVSELWSWAEHISYPERVQELHDMRIAAKRLRYCLEFFTVCFGKGLKDGLSRFKKLQDFLGEIHDCDIWLDYLAAQLKGALKGLTRRPDALAGQSGNDRFLIAQIEGMRNELGGGAVPGLLLLMEDVVRRRKKLYDDFLVYWSELEELGFREELISLVADASRSGEAELAKENLN